MRIAKVKNPPPLLPPPPAKKAICFASSVPSFCFVVLYELGVSNDCCCCYFLLLVYKTIHYLCASKGLKSRNVDNCISKTSTWKLSLGYTCISCLGKFNHLNVFRLKKTGCFKRMFIHWSLQNKRGHTHTAAGGFLFLQMKVDEQYVLDALTILVLSDFF